MLKLAYLYKDKLNEKYAQIAFDERYKFYVGQYWSYSLDINDNSWDVIQMVSVDKNDNVIGYLSANVDRFSNKASSVGAINFDRNINLVFSKDLHKFLEDLFIKYNFRKVEWWVIVGNPAEKMYNKIIKKYGGKVTGIKKESIMTPDGILADVKEYELFRETYVKK